MSHPAHTKAQEDDYVQIADRLGLVKTGGSDMHIPRPEPQKMVGGTYCDWDEVLQYLERLPLVKVQWQVLMRRVSQY